METALIVAYAICASFSVKYRGLWRVAERLALMAVIAYVMVICMTCRG